MFLAVELFRPESGGQIMRGGIHSQTKKQRPSIYRHASAAPTNNRTQKFRM
jgi:hypothetical protein